MRHLVTLLFAAACVWGIGCEDQTTQTFSGGIPTPLPLSPDSSVFIETIDLTVGNQIFHSVDVLGTIRFEITSVADSSSAEMNATRKPYEVFVHTEMTFRRSQDYTMAQDWSAGGKSGHRMMLDEGSTALLHDNACFAGAFHTVFLSQPFTRRQMDRLSGR